MNKQNEACIRPFQEEDRTRILAINKESLDSPFPDCWFADRPDGVSTYALVAKCGGGVEGFVIYRLRDEGVYVECLAVCPAMRKLGLARSLMSAVLVNTAQLERTAVRLHVSPENQAAEKLYLSMGFKCVHVSENYYGKGKAGHLFRLDLAEPCREAA